VRRIRPLAERVFEKVEPTLFCWTWHGAISEAGYGVVGLGRRGEGNGLVHRVVYELLVGPIPPGMDLDHLCRNRWCCNPGHLEPVTRQVNVDRGAHAKGWAEKEITHCVNGHEFTPGNTWRSAKQRHCRACARDRRIARKKAAA
jgi:hypothetical protein